MDATKVTIEFRQQDGGPAKTVGPFRSVTVNRGTMFGEDDEGDPVLIGERDDDGYWTLVNDDTPYQSFTVRGVG